MIGVSIFGRPAASFEAGRHGRGLGGCLGANVLGQEIGMLTQAVRRALNLDYDGMVEDAIQKRGAPTSSCVSGGCILLSYDI